MRRIYREFDIARDGEFGAVRIIVYGSRSSPFSYCFLYSIARIAVNIAHTVYRRPALKVVLVICSVAHIYGVGGFGLANRNFCNLGTNSNTFTINICNSILFENGCIVSNFTVFSIKSSCS